MKVKYDVSGVDPGGDRDLPKPGVHTCKVISAVFNDKPGGDKSPRLELQYQITEGDSKGAILYDYLPEMESMQWKWAQLVNAMGLRKKGAFDPDEIVGTALSVRVRIQPASDQFEASAKPAGLFPLDGDADEEDLDDEDGIDHDASDDDEDEPYTEEDLEALDKSDLKEAAEEFDVEFPTRLTAKGKAKVIAAILEAQEEGDEEDDEDDEDEDTDGPESREDLDDYDEDDLKALIEEDDDLEIELTKTKTVRGKKKKVKRDLDEVRDEIAEALGLDGSDDEDEDEDDDEETPDYNDWELSDLKKECKKRELSSTGPRKALVKRLEKDDEPF